MQRARNGTRAQSLISKIHLAGADAIIVCFWIFYIKK
jgi:hypothetical protein